MSSASSVRALLEGFAAGRVSAGQVARAVAAAYYDAPHAAPQPLRELAELIEREAPGMVELAARSDGPGFDVRAAARPLPDHLERELRRLAPALLTGAWGEAPRAAPLAAATGQGWWGRLVRAMRRVFSGGS